MKPVQSRLTHLSKVSFYCNETLRESFMNIGGILINASVTVYCQSGTIPDKNFHKSLEALAVLKNKVS